MHAFFPLAWLTMVTKKRRLENFPSTIIINRIRVSIFFQKKKEFAKELVRDERERDSLTRTTHRYYPSPPENVSHLGDREEGELKRRRVEHSLSRGNRSRNTPVAKPGQLSDFGRGEQRNNNNGQIVAAPRSDAIFSPRFLSPLSLSLAVEEERERKKLSRCSDQLTLMSDIFGRRWQKLPFHACAPPKTVHFYCISARLNSFNNNFN